MPVYIPKASDVIACQWRGHADTSYDIAEYPVEKSPGSSGYNGKLGYVYIDGKMPLIVRPNEYVVVEGKNKVKTMTQAEFEASYTLKVENEPKQANNGKKPGPKEDNAQTDIEDVI